MITPSNINSIGSIVIWNGIITNGNTANNVVATFTIPSDFEVFAPPTLSKGVYNSGASTVTLAMLPNEQVTFSFTLQLTAMTNGFTFDYDFVATVAGLDTIIPNNVLTDTVSLTTVTCGPLGSSTAGFSAAVEIDLKEFSTPCTIGDSQYSITPLSLVNLELLSIDQATGIVKVAHIDPSLNGTFEWNLSCVVGLDTLSVSCGSTHTVYKLVSNLDFTNVTINNVEYADLSPTDISTLEAQYPGLDLTLTCWTLIKNTLGITTSGIPFQCNESIDTRTFYVCSAVACVAGDGDCPCSNEIPVDVLTALPVGYLPEIGDIVFVDHPTSTSVWEYKLAGWVRSTCGCVAKASPITGMVFTGTNSKTLTITFADGTTRSASFTDLQEAGQAIVHADCSVASGEGTELSPLVVDVPLPEYTFRTPAYNPGDAANVVDVSTLFDTVCPGDCAPVYQLQPGGYSTLVYSAVTLVGTTLTFTVRADAPSGNHPIVVNRICG